MLAEIMSEVTEAPVILQPAKSEDKLEIEKEEAGEKEAEKVEQVGEKAVESDEKVTESDEKAEETKEEEKAEEKPAEVEESEVKEVKEEKEKEGEEEKVENVGDEEQKDSEDVGEKKKFSLSQIKTPKIIKEIRSRSKSRDKKKKKEGEDTEGAEGAEGGEEKAEEGGEEAEKAEESDLINEAKAKVKDAMENINLPKMPKVHKPEFMKKKGKKKGKKGKTEETGENKETDEAKEEKTEDKDEKPEGEEKADEDISKTEVKEEATEKKDDAEDSKEGEKMEGEKSEGVEGEGEKKETEEDAVPEKKSSVLDSLKAMKAPKMPKMPKFGKKDAPSEEKDEEKEEKTEGTTENESDEKKEEGDKEGEEKDGEEPSAEKKSSIMDSLKGMKAPKMPKMPKFPKSKKEEGGEGTETAEEEKKLLEGEEKKEETDGAEKEAAVANEEKAKEAEESAPKEKTKAPSLLANLRHVASGLPALFSKKEPAKEGDVEAGETEELLEKKEGDGVKMEEIKLDIGDEEKKDEADTKSVGSEKKDPEKGEGEEPEKKKLTDIPSQAIAGFLALDQPRRNGLIGVGAGLILLLLIIIIAACAPGGWTSSHRLVEGGKFVETVTSCGKVRGHVEGHNRYLFQSLPYSVPVARFSHSRMPSSVDECGEELLQPANSSTTCLRMTQAGMVGDEDCLTLDVATSSVVYDNPMPVVVYLPGDDETLRPTTALAVSQGVVWVTVNVRQGVLGFLSHNLLSEKEQPPTSGNYGLGDLVTALTWVNTNIAHFGGDPTRVTVLGHQQGASLALALTAVESADNLYYRVWSSAAAARLGELSLAAANEQWKSAVDAVCPEGSTRSCLVDVDVDKLLKQPVEQYWAHDDLPSKGEREMAGWLVADSRLLSNTVVEVWKTKPAKVPIVIGSARQAEANAINYQFSSWNDTNQVEAIVEGQLGSFNGELPKLAIAEYKTGEADNNWAEYSAMVTDLRTICPLETLVATMKTEYKFPIVSLYTATETRQGDAGLETGNVADAGMDLAAILGLLDSSRFEDNLQRKFLSFAKGHISRLHRGITQFGDQISRVDELDRCSFWTSTQADIVPSYAKRF